MAYRKIVRGVKRVAKKIGIAAKKRYFRGKGFSRPKIGRMAKDVAMLKRMVNAEKKQLQYKSAAAASYNVAQLNANASGHYVMDITPVPSEGAASYQRNGGSIKWTSSYLEFCMSKNPSGNQACRYLIEIWKINNQPYTSTNIQNGTFMSDLFQPNEYITTSAGAAVAIYDTVASRDQDTFKNFKRIASKWVSFSANQISSNKQIKVVKLPLKLGHHVKYASYQTGDTNTVTSGQCILTIRADNGNYATTASTNLQVAVPEANTGCQFFWSHTHYYIDN